MAKRPKHKGPSNISKAAHRAAKKILEDLLGDDSATPEDELRISKIIELEFLERK